MSTSFLRLKKDQERRLLAGHCWIYSNEVETDATPLKAFEPGQPVQILSNQGRWLGHGYVNPHSLICSRLVSRNRKRPASPSLWTWRIRMALDLRERLYAHPFYRLIFGESDGLPGLIVDRYGDLLAVQITTAGMERVRADILAALEQVVRPKSIILRNDSRARELEGLAREVETVIGDVPRNMELREGNARFRVDPSIGQKTGWFYDQAENRVRLPRFGIPDRVLDLCSYVGAWGIQAATSGARDVVCVDSSPTALERAGENADRNGITNSVRGLQGDAFEVLRLLREQQERFGLVILDPPAFIKRRKDGKEGSRAYLRLNQLGMELVESGGLLVTSSCSYHMGRDSFLRTVQQAARRTGRNLQLLEAAGQGPDHPVHPAIPETAYLKTFFFRVLPEY